MFRTAEELEQSKDLNTVSLIFKLIVPLVLGDCLDFILKEENFKNICAIFECIFDVSF